MHIVLKDIVFWTESKPSSIDLQIWDYNHWNKPYYFENCPELAGNLFKLKHSINSLFIIIEQDTFVHNVEIT